MLERAMPIEPAAFPNPPKSGGTFVATTIANVRFLLEYYGIVARYDVIRKKLIIRLPGRSDTPDNADGVALTHIISLATLNRMSTSHIPEFVATIADGNPWNPVADWIGSKPWDGVDRLPELFDTLSVRDDFPEGFKQRILYCWLLSCVAAAFKPSGFTCRGVLTIQGAQGVGKTRWIGSLVPDEQLRDEVVRLGHHMDARNKDDVIAAVCHWIVEIGELDSSFKKDIAALKGFLTNNRDKIRRPYGRVDSEYPRKTVFAATVNDPNFLVDSTGNTRFWTLPVVAINYDHRIDMQQVFAQLLIDFRSGAQWWLKDEEQAYLEERNRDHRTVSAIYESISSSLDLSRRGDPNLPAMTATELLTRLGFKSPRNAQCKECAATLRELLGEPKRINGNVKWRIPFAEVQFSATAQLNDVDRY
jgi:predicted P-loop ATPase